MLTFTAITFTCLISGLVHNVDGDLQPIDDFSLKTGRCQWRASSSTLDITKKILPDSKLIHPTQPTFTDYLNRVDPVDSLKQPLEQMGSSLNKVVSLLGTESFGFLDAVKGITVEAGAQLGNGLQGVVNELSNDLRKLPDLLSSGGQTLLDGLGSLGNGLAGGLTNLANSIGDGLKNTGQQIYNGLTDLFGRRRRTLDAADRVCLDRCDDVCWQLMSDDKNVVLTNVCGSYVVTLNTTIHHTINKVTSLYNATLDTVHPIITKVEIDRGAIDSTTLSTDIVYITANIKGQTTRYQSSVPYRLMDIPSTVRDVAQEFWRLWR